VDETRLPGEGAEDYVRRLAEAKARVIIESRVENTAESAKEREPAIVVGADTAVVVEGEILGKPQDADEARRMLRRLSGRTHEVLTGLCVIGVPEGPETLHVERTRVTFLELSSGEVEDYIATGEPFDKAGAYGIQGIGGRFVRRIEGCYFNVMGLPLAKLWSLIRAFEKEQAAGG